MNNLDKLITYFERFPGIGARQARRFAFHILTLPETETAELASLINSLQGTVVECASCHRFFSKSGSTATECNICSDANRDRQKLTVVTTDTDITAIERSGSYDGLYFVLGGTIPLLDTKSAPKLRSGALKGLVEHRLQHDELQEIILAFAVNPDGENTARFVQSLLAETIAGTTLTISELGRGLSTGSELEYADPETLKNAFSNRH